MRRTYTAVFTDATDGGYVVVVPAIQGCVTYGRTLTEAVLMVEEAIQLCLEVLLEDGERIPRERGGVVVDIGRKREALLRKVTVTVPEAPPATAAAESA